MSCCFIYLSIYSTEHSHKLGLSGYLRLRYSVQVLHNFVKYLQFFNNVQLELQSIGILNIVNGNQQKLADLKCFENKNSNFGPTKIDLKIFPTHNLVQCAIVHSFKTYTEF